MHVVLETPGPRGEDRRQRSPGRPRRSACFQALLEHPARCLFDKTLASVQRRFERLLSGFQGARHSARSLAHLAELPLPSGAQPALGPLVTRSRERAIADRSAPANEVKRGQQLVCRLGWLLEQIARPTTPRRHAVPAHELLEPRQGPRLACLEVGEKHGERVAVGGRATPANDLEQVRDLLVDVCEALWGLGADEDPFELRQAGDQVRLGRVGADQGVFLGRPGERREVGSDLRFRLPELGRAPDLVSPEQTAADEQNEAERDRGDHTPVSAPKPPAITLPPTGRSGHDRLAATEAGDVFGEFERARVARPLRLGQRLEADRVQIRGGVGPVHRDGVGVVGEDLFDDLVGLVAHEGRPPGHELVEDRAERVDVREVVDLGQVAVGLLWGHVGRRAHDLTGLGQPLPFRVEGQPEIGHEWLPVVPEEDVRRLEVAVQDTLGVAVGDRARDRLGVCERLVDREPTQLLDDLAQVAPFDEVEDRVGSAAVGAADVADADDASVGVDLGDRLRLALKSSQRSPVRVGLGEHHLERDLDGARRVLRAVDRAHPALPEHP